MCKYSVKFELQHDIPGVFISSAATPYKQKSPQLFFRSNSSELGSEALASMIDGFIRSRKFILKWCS